MPSIISLIDEIKRNHEEPGERDLEDMKSWEAEAARLMAITSVEQIEGISLIVKKFSNDVKIINDKLLKERDMPQEERISLFDRREFMLSVIDIFLKAHTAESALASTLEEQIEYLKNFDA